MGTDPLWTISDSIKCIILIGQIIFNFLQLQIPGREVPSNRIIHWGLMAALPLYFFNMLGANAPFYAGWQAFIVLNTMTLNIIAICGLYVVFNTIRVNYMTARLMKRIPTNLNMYFYSSAGIAVVMNTSAMVIILCIDRQSIDCMRFLALLICVLFGGAALTYNWSVLRISIKRVFSNFFDEGNNNHGENEIKYEKQDATITSSDYMRLKDPQIISGRGHRHARSSVKDLVVSKGTISKDVSTASILQQDEHPSSPTPMTPKSPSSSTDIVADPTNATSGTRAPTTMGTKKPTHRYYASDVSVDFAVMKNGEAMETELKVVRESKSSAASEGIRKGSRRSMLHSVKRARSRSRSRSKAMTRERAHALVSRLGNLAYLGVFLTIVGSLILLLVTFLSALSQARYSSKQNEEAHHYNPGADISYYVALLFLIFLQYYSYVGFQDVDCWSLDIV
mmetsp:Transcript_18326/g.29210  ORF Transcript_18326/g.29210 Transcript_18326/m.29210 type:complete len:451 (+) Transcript_18326:79-1431(+)